jgi:predicted DNA-binding protein
MSTRTVKRSVMLHVRISESQHERWKALAASYEKTMAEIIRDAVDEFEYTSKAWRERHGVPR